MITCHRSYLEARCQERGYTLAEVMPCVISQAGDVWTIDETNKAYPSASRTSGLGDWVASGLSAVGITPERVSALIGRPCGCKQRQQALNRLGARLGLSRPLPAPVDDRD